MANVLIVAHLLIVLSLIGVILLQRSEGGGLGMGGGSNAFMSVRGSANLLTRTTAILAALFFATAIGLTLLANYDRPNQGIIDRAIQETDATAPTNVLDALNQLNGETPDNATTPATGGPDLALPTPAPATDPVTVTTPATEPATAITPVTEPVAITPATLPAVDTTVPATTPAADTAPANEATGG